MTIPVSKIHAAGGLDKWIRKQDAYSKKPHDAQRRSTKTAQVIDGMAKVKCEAMKRNSDVPTEHEEQVAFVEWARLWLPEELRGLLFAIPNGGMRHKKTAADLKAEGCVRGVPDLLFAWPRLGKHGLFIEMKRTKSGNLSKEQKEMIERLNKAGYAVVVAKGCQEAQDAVRRYMFGRVWDA
jgi:hypothetical protein